MKDEKDAKTNTKDDAHESGNEESSFNLGVWSPFVGVGIGIVALLVFSQSQEIHILVKTILIIVGLTALIHLFMSAKPHKISDKEETSTDKLDTKVEHKASSKSSVKKSNATVTNRVKMPNPTPVQNKEETKSTEEQEPTVEEKPKAEDVKTDGMSISDWEDFF